MTTTSAKHKKLLFRKMAHGDLITIEVDAELVKYRVHEVLLVNYCEYFQRALNGQWTEADDRVVRLEDVDSDTFGRFVDWLYTNELPFSVGSMCTKLNEDEAANLQISRLKLFALADRLQCSTLIRSLRRHITSQIIEYETVYSKFLAFAYKNLDGEHPFLQLVVDSYCADVWRGVIQTDVLPSEDVPKAFLLRVVGGLVHLRQNKEPSKTLPLQGCNYHGHSSEEDRKLCQKEEAEEERCQECGK